MEIIPEKDVEVVAEKILTKIRDKIKSQIGDAFYTEYSGYLYEHYVNHKDKIDEKLIAEIVDKFIEDPKSYKYSGLRKRLYEENKTEINKTITEDILTEGLKNIIVSLLKIRNNDICSMYAAKVIKSLQREIAELKSKGDENE